MAGSYDLSNIPGAHKKRRGLSGRLSGGVTPPRSVKSVIGRFCSSRASTTTRTTPSRYSGGSIVSRRDSTG